MHFITTLFIFFFASAYVLVLDYVAFSSRSLQQAFTAVLLTVFLLIYRYHFKSWRGLATPEGKFFFLFLGTILIQLLVLSTGGLKSPFLILIHLCMVMISFVFTFPVSLLFLLFCLITLFVDLSFSQNFITLIESNPSLALLQLLSLIVIIPVAYLVSQQYHMKETLTKFLQSRVKTTEAILKSIPEIIIITNPSLHILSVNDAAVKTLQRSQSELLDKQIFDVLLLKDAHGKVVTEKTFFSDGKIITYPQTTEVFTLIMSSFPERFVKIQIKPLTQANNEASQFSFILSFEHAPIPQLFDKARTRYEALLQNIKEKLEKQSPIKTDILLLEKIEEDTYLLPSIQEPTTQTPTHIDLAKLCEQIVRFNKEFAKELGVTTQFNLPHFGQEDIAPLTVANYPVKPEQLTGPFFTVIYDVPKIELLIKKLFDITILLASSPGVANIYPVTLNVEREKSTDSVRITCIGNCPPFTNAELQEIFHPYYPKLEDKTNLHIGSGLEGYIVKKLADQLKLSLHVNYNIPTAQIVFTLLLPKKGNVS